MAKPQNPVVASLGNRSPHPYSSIAMSPNRQYAIVAGKDTLHLVKVSPKGLTPIRSLKISQHFQTPTVSPADQRPQGVGGGGRYVDVNFVRDTFGLGAPGTKQQQLPTQQQQQQQQHAPRPNMAQNTNVVVTSVAWSLSLAKPARSDSSTGIGGGGSSERDDYSSMTTDGKQKNANNRQELDKNSIIAAAGSNGVVVVWNAGQFLVSVVSNNNNNNSGSNSNSNSTTAGRSSTTTMGNLKPEATLSLHTRAVNSLAWHPRLPGLLLSASQDATVKLWGRRDNGPRVEQDQSHQLKSWFGSVKSTRAPPERSYSWYCHATFEPKSEAIRDIQWSKHQDDIFALVTVSGSLIIYSMHVSSRAILKVAAHTGDATTLDWHPTRPYVIATGGSNDRTVKVWDVENSVNMKMDDKYMAYNAGTGNSQVSMNSASSSETDPFGPLPGGFSIGGSSQPIGSRPFSGSYQGATSRHKAGTLQVLSMSAAVTKLRWRPPSGDSFSVEGEEDVDRHDSMLCVATARLSTSGGSGVLSLWSFHRPFMPLSVVEGHEEGPVTDFVWLDTPAFKMKQNKSPYLVQSDVALSSKKDPLRHAKGQSSTSNDGGDPIGRTSVRDSESMQYEQKDKDKDDDKSRVSSQGCIWQPVLSVGRDGRCLLQSFARGDRPISRVPSSCFAMANLSPFQSGYGSLQVFSVYQRVPKGPKNDFLLTGLRQDVYTAGAPGVFKEVPPEGAPDDTASDQSVAGRRLPVAVPDIVFNVIDGGDLDQNGTPIGKNENAITIAPEVVHLSRFASSYKFYPDDMLPTRVDLCLHNGNVAEQLRCGPLARMWRALASMLSGSALDELPQRGGAYQPLNAMQFVLLPTIKSLLEERADAGDVQTCVAVCEVLQVIQLNQQTRIPGLEINRVREWYLAYIDLLHQMCLFSSATFLIRSCNDPYIGALNQQSTTIHESCPRCGKPLPPASAVNAGETSSTSARRACKNCRRRVGLCFLCHEPVKGMYVWCPGCGHGGHLEHALQWFGGLSGKPVREMCPTGCGHRCNLSQTLNAFPRTDSLMCLSVSSPSLEIISLSTK